MSFALRITLFVFSLLTFVFIISRIRKSKIRLEDSIFWLCLGALLLILAIFPQIFFFFSGLIGTMAPVNLVFLFFIFILLIATFNLSMRISRADTRIKELTQQLAIEKLERYENDLVHESKNTSTAKEEAHIPTNSKQQ